MINEERKPAWIIRSSINRQKFLNVKKRKKEETLSFAQRINVQK